MMMLMGTHKTKINQNTQFSITVPNQVQKKLKITIARENYFFSLVFLNLYKALFVITDRNLSSGNSSLHKKNEIQKCEGGRKNH